jgi:hypothetical protein
MEGLRGGEGLSLGEIRKRDEAVEQYKRDLEAFNAHVPLTDVQQLELGRDMLSRAEESGEKLRKALLGL